MNNDRHHCIENDTWQTIAAFHLTVCNLFIHVLIIFRVQFFFIIFLTRYFNGLINCTVFTPCGPWRDKSWIVCCLRSMQDHFHDSNSAVHLHFFLYFNLCLPKCNVGESLMFIYMCIHILSYLLCSIGATCLPVDWFFFPER